MSLPATVSHLYASIQRDLEFLKVQQAITPQQYDDVLRILPALSNSARGNLNSSPMSAPMNVPSPVSNNTPPPPPPTYNSAVSNTETAEALYDFNGSNAEDLSFRQGDIIEIKEKVNNDWWRGSLNGRSGLFPSNYVKPLPTSTPKEKPSSHYPPPPSASSPYPPPSSTNNNYPPPPSASSPYNSNASYPPPPSASPAYPPPSNYGNNGSYPPPPAANNNSSYNYPPPPQQQAYSAPPPQQEATPSSHNESNGFSTKAGGMFKNVATKVGDAATMGFGATLGSQAAHSLF